MRFRFMIFDHKITHKITSDAVVTWISSFDRIFYIGGLKNDALLLQCAAWSSIFTNFSNRSYESKTNCNMIDLNQCLL